VKQRITIEDLQQLSPEQQERLRKWWRPEPGDISLSPQGIEKVYVGDITQKDRNTPLLSIGQCIELAYYCNSKSPLHIPMRGEKENPKTFYMTCGDDVEIIDALFAAVKEVL
jgi:hypothetical protein